MPQLDYNTYYHQLFTVLFGYIYIYAVVAFYFAPIAFLRPRLLFLMQTYTLQYIQFMIFYVSKFFDLKVFNVSINEMFSSFISTGFGSLYLFYKSNQFSFFGLYFNTFSNFKLILNEKFSSLTFFDVALNDYSYAQDSFLFNID